MKNWLEKYRIHAKDRKFLVSLGVSMLFLFVAMMVTLLTIFYATESSSGPVTDIILSHIPVFNVGGIFVYGPVLFWLLILAYLASEPRKTPFTFKSIAVFLLIRSFFVSLTHIGPFPTHITLDTKGILGLFTSGNDLFFSNHTGLPFFMALIFWDNRTLRYFCLASSVFFGAIVLMAHVHYSIDVFAAFFITYTIFHICQVLFKADRMRSLGSPVRS